MGSPINESLMNKTFTCDVYSSHKRTLALNQYERYEILKGLTDDDKLHIMGDLVTKMDVDGDSEIEPSELATWIHYVEQTRYNRHDRCDINLLVLVCTKRYTSSFPSLIPIAMSLFPWRSTTTVPTTLFMVNLTKVV